MNPREQAINKEISRRLLILRKRYHLSQIEIGKVIGVTFQQVQKYEAAANKISISKLILLLDYLDVNICDFFNKEMK